MKLLNTIIFSLLCISISAQWEEITPPPADFRTDHSFGFSISGKGYLLTGKTSSELTADFYSYSPNEDEWTKLPDFPGGTRGFGIGEVWEDKAYFGFGQGMHPDSTSSQLKKDLWSYDPLTEEWVELAECPCNPRLHPAFVTHKGNIYVGLGNGSGFGNMKDWWQYNIETNTWTQKTDFPSHERHHPFQFAVGDFVYVGFGHGSVSPIIYNQWYQYDPETDTWLEVAEIPGEGRVAGTQFAHNDFGYVLSGDGQDHQSMEFGEFWQYDAANDLWTEMPPHPGFSRWAPASFILDDEVYLINGSSYGQYQDKAYKYNLEPPTTSTLDINKQVNDIQTYPNPFFNEINIDLNKIDLKELKSVKLMVYDVLGEIVFQTDIKAKINNIHMPNLRTGSYTAVLFADGSQLSSEIIIKK